MSRTTTLFSFALLALLLSAPSLVHAQAPVAAPVAPPVAAPAAPSADLAAPATTQGDLLFSVVVVDELTPKPVPFTDFTVTGGNAPIMVRTDIQGTIDQKLDPGTYTIQNVKPLSFKDHAYSWNKTFTITAGAQTKLTLTDADATTVAVKPHREIGDEAKLYESLKGGCVTVEGDLGQGSGFLVDSRGLILTNHHVISGGRWAAVRFEHGKRIPAVIVADDSVADVAVIAVNPVFCTGRPVISLADSAQGALAVEGEKVLTIGSPLGQEKVLTTGIVSKVAADYLISDININHGNSGGPLLNMAGDAIGLTTFLTATTNGPSISGIVAITKALPVLAQARDKIASIQSPPTELLPDVSDTNIPQEALDAALVKDTKPWLTDNPKNFETLVVTPFYGAALSNEAVKQFTAEKRRRLKKRDKNGIQEDLGPAPNPFWARYALHIQDPVVVVEVRPLLKEKSASIWGGVIDAMAKVPHQAHMEFRDDFWDMALYRGDTLVHPVERVRQNVQDLYADDNIQVNDMAMGGVYFYDPSVFEPSQKLTLYVRRESDLNRWDIVHIDEKEQAKIWSMFLPYRAALGDEQAQAIVGLSPTVHTPPIAGSETANSELMNEGVAALATPEATAAPTPPAPVAPTPPAPAPAAAAPLAPASAVAPAALPVVPAAMPAKTATPMAAPVVPPKAPVYVPYVGSDTERQTEAAVLAHLGKKVDWHKYGVEQMQTMEDEIQAKNKPGSK